MFPPNPNLKISVGNLQFSEGPQFEVEFEDLITANEKGYLDPSKYDLTGDKRDPDEDLNKTKRRELFCFHCHRPEMHSRATRFGFVYSFLIGLTLGLIKVIGPYYCRCCGHRRFLGSDRIHPKYWLHRRRLQKHGTGRRSR